LSLIDAYAQAPEELEQIGRRGTPPTETGDPLSGL
jgi:hypothetical protein